MAASSLAVHDLQIDAEFQALIPPLSAEERQQLEAGCLGFYGEADGEYISLLPTVMGRLWWLASRGDLTSGTEDYTKRPIAQSRLVASDLFSPVRAGRIRLYPRVSTPVEIDYFDRPNTVKRKFTGTLYVIEAVGTQFVKIGIAGIPHVRLASLQTASPFQLRLVATHQGSKEDEASLHRRFAESRVLNEWFLRSEAIDAMCEEWRR